MDSEYKLDRYLNIDNYIKYLELVRRDTQKEIYNQTLATHLVFDGLSIHTKAPKIEHIISDNLEACELIDDRIARWKARKKYFIQYLSRLPIIERESLKKGLASPSMQRNALDEIREIETAIAFIYGWSPPSEPIELTNDLFMDIERMAEAFL